MSDKTITHRRRYLWRLALLLLIVLPFLPEIAIRGIAEVAKMNGCVVDEICSIGGQSGEQAAAGGGDQGRQGGQASRGSQGSGTSAVGGGQGSASGDSQSGEQAAAGGGDTQGRQGGQASRGNQGSGTSAAGADQGTTSGVAGTKVGGAISGLLNVALLFAEPYFTLPWLLMCYLLITLGWTRLVVRLSLALSVSLIFAVLPYLAPWWAIDRLTNAECKPDLGGGHDCMIFGGHVEGANDAFLLHELGIVSVVGVPIALSAAAIYLVMVAIIRGGRALARLGRRQELP